MSSAYARTPPLGIKIICVVGVLGGFAGIVLGVLSFGSPVLGILMVVFSVASLFVLYGLWTLQSWAWTWTLILYALNALFSMVAGDVGGILISVIVFGYVASKGDLYR